MAEGVGAKAWGAGVGQGCELRGPGFRPQAQTGPQGHGLASQCEQGAGAE